MQQPLTVTISLSLYLFVLFHTVLCAQVETEAFDVNTEVLSPTRARISWFGIGDEEGVSASRYRVLCTSPDSHAVEAITKEKSVEIDTFTPGRTYTCEVHPVWYNLVEGMEVLSANPAISEPFEMTFEGEALKHTTEKPTTAESGEAIVKVMAIPKVNAEAKSDGIVKVTWTSVEENGVAASRYRVICYSTRPYKKPIKVASVRQTEVDIEAFEAGLEYTCSVYGIWDDLVPGIEVLSMNPGVSNSFTIPNTAGRNPAWTFTFLPLSLLIVVT